MSHKEMCCDWVNDRTHEDDNGLFWAWHCEQDEPIGGPFNTPDELETFLWDEVMKEDFT